MIPADFISPNKRLKWEYFFDEKGAATEVMRNIMETGRSSDFVRQVLPFHVQTRWFDKEKDESLIDDEWMAEHLRGAWTLWLDGVYFERSEDAFWFKMNFYETRSPRMLPP